MNNRQELKRPFEEAFAELNADIITNGDLAILKDQGYVVIRKVVSEAFVDEMNSYIDQWFKSIPCYNGKLTSYQAKVHNIMKGEGVGHNFSNWMLRTHPNVISIWCKLWNCTADQLVVSLDGFRQMPSSYKPKKEDGVVKSWTHVDEGDIANDLIINITGNTVPLTKAFDGSVSFQMSIATSDVDENDGCFLCIPKGHTHFKEMVSGKEMFQILGKEKLDFLAKKGLVEKRITGIKKGDAIIWNSKTPHRGDSALVDNGKISSVVFVCYTHRNNISKGDLVRRKAAFGSIFGPDAKSILATSSHSPGGNNFKVNAPPRLYGAKTKEEQEKQRIEMRPSEKEIVCAWDVSSDIFPQSLFRLYHSLCYTNLEICNHPLPSSYTAPSEQEVMACFKKLHEKKLNK